MNPNAAAWTPSAASTSESTPAEQAQQQQNMYALYQQQQQMPATQQPMGYYQVPASHPGQYQYQQYQTAQQNRGGGKRGKPTCKFFASPKGCRYGDRCKFSHNVDPSTSNGGMPVYDQFEAASGAQGNATFEDPGEDVDAAFEQFLAEMEGLKVEKKPEEDENPEFDDEIAEAYAQFLEESEVVPPNFSTDSSNSNAGEATQQ